MPNQTKLRIFGALRLLEKYYRVLGLDSDATTREIKAAFRAKVKLYHPDKSGTQDTRDKFIQVNEAYAILMRRDELVRHLMRKYARKQAQGTPRHTATEMQSHAGKYADMSYEDFEKTPLYRTAIVLNFTFDYVFVAVGFLMIATPFVSYFLFDDDIQSVTGDKIRFPFLPIVLGVAFLFGLWHFIFKQKRLDYIKRKQRLE